MVIHENLDSPRGIILLPSSGYMFWTDWSYKEPKIERSRMDGSERTVLVNKTTLTDIRWPNGLAVDFDTNVIYWTDANADAIFRMDLDGGLFFLV